MNLCDLKGLTIVSIKCFQSDRRYTKMLESQYILFSDKKTYIELEEQDYYTYHDCSVSARNINVIVNAKRWDIMYNNKDGCFPDANC